MSDLTTQIREHARQLDDRYPDVSLEELMERLQPPVGPPRRQWNGLLVAIAAAVLVVLLGLLTYLVSNQQTAPVVDQPIPPPTAPSTSVPSKVDDPTTMEIEGREPAEVRTVETSLGTWTTLRYDGDIAGLEALFDPSFGPPTLETPDLPDPGLQEAEWHETDTHSSALVSQIAVSTVSAAVTFDWEALDPRLARGAWWVEGERALAFDGERPEDVILDVDLVAGAVEFRHRDTGQLVLRLVPPASITAQQLIAEGSRVASGRWMPVIWALYVDNGETSGWVQPPWSGRAVESVDVTAWGDQFVLVASVRPDWEEEDRTSTIHTWRSSDGITWTESGTPFKVGEFDRGLDVEGDENSVSLRLDGDGARLLVFSEGAVWEEVGPPIRAHIAAGPRPVSFGWMMVVEDDQLSCRVYISRDLRSWESIPLAPYFEPPDAGSSGCSIDGDHAIALAGGTTTGSYWIGGFGD